MKLVINEHQQLEFAEVYNSIVINTPTGEFGICQRDGGLVLMYGAVEIFNSIHPLLIDEQTKSMLASKLNALRNEMNVKFNNSEGENALYCAGYLKAIEDIMELV